MADATRLGNRLRMARERRGLSQQAVAGEFGLPRTAVTGVENGSRTVSTLEITKLMEICGCSAAFLLAADEEPEAQDPSSVLHRALPGTERAPEVDTAVRRLFDLYRECETLRQMLDLTIEQREPLEVSEQELRSQLMRLAIEAFRQEEISRGRLVEIGRKLGIGGDALLELAEATRHG